MRWSTLFHLASPSLQAPRDEWVLRNLDHDDDNDDDEDDDKDDDDDADDDNDSNATLTLPLILVPPRIPDPDETDGALLPGRDSVQACGGRQEGWQQANKNIQHMEPL